VFLVLTGSSQIYKPESQCLLVKDTGVPGSHGKERNFVQSFIGIWQLGTFKTDLVISKNNTYCSLKTVGFETRGVLFHKQFII
jgi:hypothetical protein